MGKWGWKQTDVKGNRIRRGEYRMDVYCNKNAGGDKRGDDAKGDTSCSEMELL